MGNKIKPLEEQKSTLKTFDDVDNSLKRIADLNVRINNITDAMNQKINSIQETYHNSLDPLQAEKIGIERDMQLYCEEQKETEFAEKRSKELIYGMVSFRKTPAALKTLKGFTWEAVKSLLMKSKKYAEYLKEKVEINKESIMNNIEKESELAKIGCYKESKDIFYYEIYQKK